jgi:uncharacterized protein involved in exopolysaccharide biosynthesis
VLSKTSSAAVVAQRTAAQDRLTAADADYNTFLTFNNIADFDAEKLALSQQVAQLRQQALTTSASLRQQQAALVVQTSQLATLPAETSVSRDLNMQSQQQLNDRRAELNKALGPYTEGSDIVRRLRADIADLERAQKANPLTPTAAQRMGPNPVYQSIQTTRADLNAQVAGLKASLEEINGQIKQVSERQLRLASLEPQYQALARERSILQDSVTEFSKREQEGLSNQALGNAGNSSIKMMSRAQPPIDGSSLKKPVAMLAFLFAGFTALCVGLLRIFLRPGMVTPDTAGRTLDLPVLATARARR